MGPVEFSGEPLACLKLDELQHCESFAAFLAAAVPPSVPLQALQLSDMRAEISAAALQGCTQLASVQCLELDFFHLDEAATAALLASTPRLTTLRLIGSWSTDLRALFVQPLPELHTLRLDSCPYSLPLELAQLTNLRRLVSAGKDGGASAGQHAGMAESQGLLPPDAEHLAGGSSAFKCGFPRVPCMHG